MNLREKKTLGILLGILVLLGIVFAIVVGVNRASAEKAQEAAAAASEGNITQSELNFTALTWKNPTATLSFTLGEDGAWYWTDDPDFPLDQSAITNMISLLSNLKPQQSIENGDTLEAYGLAEPEVSLIATQADGSEMTVAMGNATTDGNSYYLLTNESDTVYVVGSTLRTQLTRGIYDMMLLPAFPTLTENSLKSVTITGAVTTKLSAVHTGADTSTETTSWFLNGKELSDSEALQTLLSQLSTLSIASCADYHPTAQAATLCGMDTPAAVLDVVYTDDNGTEQTLSLTIGNLNAAGDGYFVQIGSEDTNIYNFSTDTLESVLSIAASGLTA